MPGVRLAADRVAQLAQLTCPRRVWTISLQDILEISPCRPSGRSHGRYGATSADDDEALPPVLHGVEHLGEAARSLGCRDLPHKIRLSERRSGGRLKISLHEASAAIWREPDSNRRHHDFQRGGVGRVRAWKPHGNAECRTVPSAAVPVDTGGFVGVWDFRRGWSSIAGDSPVGDRRARSSSRLGDVADLGGQFLWRRTGAQADDPGGEFGIGGLQTDAVDL